MQEKNLQLDRMVFFCDAVVAIAITLLAFNIKIEHTSDGHLRLSDIAHLWKQFAAFFLSFINIANFWKIHHSFFAYIKKIDEKLLWYNIMWLLFIILIPFSTSLVSTYFTDHAAISIYSLNTLLVAIFQNNIWDYTAMRKDFLKTETIDDYTIWRIRLFCNLDMINAGVAIIVAYFSPTIAFILLLSKIPMMLIIGIRYREHVRNKKLLPTDKNEADSK
jgi:uncharacterized membrane protein